MTTTAIPTAAREYNARLLESSEVAKTWRTARPGHEEYMLRVSGIFPVTLVDKYWFASAQERSLWALAHMGWSEYPNRAGAAPQFLAQHVNGWSDPEADADFVNWFRFKTCEVHQAIMTPMVPGEPGLECGLCVADHDAHA